jgi:hypothetical protein
MLRTPSPGAKCLTTRRIGFAKRKGGAGESRDPEGATRTIGVNAANDSTDTCTGDIADHVADQTGTPSCCICEKTSTTPQVSAIRPLTKRKMKISLYAIDLPVGERPM